MTENDETGGVAEKMRGAVRIGRALRIVWESAPGWTVANSVLVFVQAGLPLVSLFLLKLIFDAVTQATGLADGEAGLGHVVLLIVLAGGVAVLSGVCRSLAALALEAQGLAVSDHMFDLLHEKSLAVDLEYYENPEFQDTLHRAQEDAPSRPARMLGHLVGCVQGAVTLLAITGLLVSFHWGVAAALLLSSVPGILIRVKYSKTIYAWRRSSTPADRKARYYNSLLTRDTAAKEVRLFGIGSLLRDRFRTWRGRLRTERIRIVRQRSLAEVVAEICTKTAVFGALGFMAMSAARSEITIGDLLMFFGAVQHGQNQMHALLSGLAGLYEENLFVSSFHDFLAVEKTVPEPRDSRPVPRPMKEGVIFEDVSFCYPKCEKEVLRGVNLRIEAGEVVALVGENGSGKTTLAKLLCRLYDPMGGSIRLDSIDLKRFHTRDLRSQISVIFQDYMHYNLTVRDNIWFGNVERPPDADGIASAARWAGAAEMIEKLPLGYDTILGKRFEFGEELSIGEWQQVALARALLRDAQIVVLDEPTSALDAEQEYSVFRLIKRLLQGRTAILISHRFSTVKLADRIYVLSDGRTIESGSHSELIERRGTYARMFEMQASSYQ